MEMPAPCKMDLICALGLLNILLWLLNNLLTDALEAFNTHYPMFISLA